jgi:malate synthase
VLDIHDVGLMEDRATLRISAQHIANWLHHRVVSTGQVRAALERMAQVVDGQNAGDRLPPDGAGLRAAMPSAPPVTWCSRDVSSSGYTEPLLHAWRLRFKQAR